MKTYFNNILLILSLAACNPISQKSDLIRVPISAPLEKSQTPSSENYLSVIDIIPLETTHESSIGEIKKIFFTDSCIYILDWQQDRILCFNNKGKFRSKIGKKGKGPGEYIQIQDFTIDRRTGNILLLCDRPYKLITLNNNGKLINDIRIHDLYRSLILEEDNLWLFPLKGNFLATKLNYKTGKKLMSVFEKNKLSKRFSIFTHLHPYTTESENLYFFDQWDNRIYDFSKKIPNAKYLIDFGDKNLSLKNIKQKSSLKEISDYCKKNGYAYFISSFTESDRYIFFRYEPARIVIYDKKMKTCINTTSFYDNELAMYLSMLYSASGYGNCYIVNIIKPVYVLRNKPYIIKNALDKRIVEIFKNLKESDNPVIMKYVLK